MSTVQPRPHREIGLRRDEIWDFSLELVLCKFEKAADMSASLICLRQLLCGGSLVADL